MIWWWGGFSRREPTRGAAAKPAKKRAGFRPEGERSANPAPRQSRMGNARMRPLASARLSSRGGFSTMVHYKEDPGAKGGQGLSPDG